jgi:hypothetical protein
VLIYKSDFTNGWQGGSNSKWELGRFVLPGLYEVHCHFKISDDNVDSGSLRIGIKKDHQEYESDVSTSNLVKVGGDLIGSTYHIGEHNEPFQVIISTNMNRNNQIDGETHIKFNPKPPICTGKDLQDTDLSGIWDQIIMNRDEGDTKAVVDAIHHLPEANDIICFLMEEMEAIDINNGEFWIKKEVINAPY